MGAHHWNVVAQKERLRLMFPFLKQYNYYPTLTFSLSFLLITLFMYWYWNPGSPDAEFEPREISSSLSWECVTASDYIEQCVTASDYWGSPQCSSNLRTSVMKSKYNVHSSNLLHKCCLAISFYSCVLALQAFFKIQVQEIEGIWIWAWDLIVF